MNVKLIIHKSKQKPYYQRIITEKYIDAILWYDSISEPSQAAAHCRKTAAHYVQPRRRHPTRVRGTVLIAAAINLSVWMFALEFAPDLQRIPATIIITTHLIGFVLLFLFHPNPARAVLVGAKA
jgi:hypothetical protein